MAEKDPNAEIKHLREQLAEMKREREAAAPPEEPEPEEIPSEEQKPAEAVDEAMGELDETVDDLATYVKELLDNLDEDLKTARPSTLLIVFALGVLIGRLR